MTELDVNVHFLKDPSKSVNKTNNGFSNVAINNTNPTTLSFPFNSNEASLYLNFVSNQEVTRGLPPKTSTDIYRLSTCLL